MTGSTSSLSRGLCCLRAQPGEISFRVVFVACEPAGGLYQCPPHFRVVFVACEPVGGDAFRVVFVACEPTGVMVLGFPSRGLLACEPVGGNAFRVVFVACEPTGGKKVPRSFAGGFAFRVVFVACEPAWSSIGTYEGTPLIGVAQWGEGSAPSWWRGVNMTL